jgi:hypothetical protein
MSEAITYQFRLTAEEMREALIFVSPSPGKSALGWYLGLVWVMSRIVVWAVYYLGALLIGFLTGLLICLPLSLPVNVEFGVTGFFMFTVIFALHRLKGDPLDRYVAATMSSPFLSDSVGWTISPVGLRWVGAHHDWQTSWGSLTEVTTGGAVLVIRIAGMIFSLPHRVIGDAVAVKTLEAQMRRWIEASRGMAA